MSLKLDYANICGGQTKTQRKQIHKIIKEMLAFLYFYSICSSLNVSQTLWMLLSPQWFTEVSGDTNCIPCGVTFSEETHQAADAILRYELFGNIL